MIIRIEPNPLKLHLSETLGRMVYQDHTLRKSENFLYGFTKIKPLRGFIGAMRIITIFNTQNSYHPISDKKKLPVTNNQIKILNLCHAD